MPIITKFGVIINIHYIMTDKTIKNTLAMNVGKAIRQRMFDHTISDGGFLLSDICNGTGFSLTTVITYSRKLLEEQYIVALDKVSGGTRGRSASRFKVNPDLAYFVGVDVSKSALRIGIMNFTGEIIDSREFSDFDLQNTRENLEQVIDSIKGFIDEQSAHIDVGKIASVCVALSGRVNYRTGTSASVYFLEEIYGSSLADVLSEQLNYTVYLENDTKAMSYGEYMSKLASRYRDVLFLNIGWGLGVGIIMNGKLHYGRDGYSGEIGHIHKFDNNIMCHCGKKGCLETEVSGRALKRQIEEHIRAGEISLLSSIVKAGQEITMKDMLRAIEETDLLTLELVDEMGKNLGKHIAALINLFNPEAIVVGGSLVNTDVNYMRSSIKVNVGKFALRLNYQNVEIINSELKQKAGVVGACLLARQRTYSDMF